MFRKLVGSGTQRRLVQVNVDSEEVWAEEGEPVAALLLRTRPFIARATALNGVPRAPYCMMGACFECLVQIDGAPSIRSCMRQVRQGMAIRRQMRVPDPAGALRDD